MIFSLVMIEDVLSVIVLGLGVCVEGDEVDINCFCSFGFVVLVIGVLCCLFLIMVGFVIMGEDCFGILMI